jgi:transcriptional regulator with PAS, ATPase and Fis domain
MVDGTFIGRSAGAGAVRASVADAARTDAKVLLIGESGVGKEVVARLIHEQGRRRLSKLQTLNCAAIPDSLLESELFGHARGSFTGAYRDKPGLLEIAHTGTAFLDEIGEMSLRMQALLLRFLENGEIWRVGADRGPVAADVRIIAATNRDLLEGIAEREFRADLYYRLNVLQIRIPPLRERRDDILLLAEYFLDSLSAHHRVPAPVLSADACQALVDYDWPGNVRELRNVVERLVVSGHAAPIRAGDLPFDVAGPRVPVRAVEPAREVPASRADALYVRMVPGGESFWSAVHPLFTARDMTRDDMRAIVARGLARAGGSYHALVDLFNMPADDYRAFVRFLRTHRCQPPVVRFGRAAPPEPELAVADG